MNDQQLDRKVRQDAAKVKKDLSTLLEHSAARLGRYESKFSLSTGKTRGELTSWMEDNLAQLNKAVDTLTGTARDTVDEAAALVKKNVGHGMRQYDAKAKAVVNKLPVTFGKKPAQFQWVPLTIALAIGLLVGFFIKPVQQLLA